MTKKEVVVETRYFSIDGLEFVNENNCLVYEESYIELMNFAKENNIKIESNYDGFEPEFTLFLSSKEHIEKAKKLIDSYTYVGNHYWYSSEDWEKDILTICINTYESEEAPYYYAVFEQYGDSVMEKIERNKIQITDAEKRIAELKAKLDF